MLASLIVSIGAVSGCRSAAPTDRTGPPAGPLFRFENRQVQSGITFRHHPTADSGRRSNHYDHGNGVLVADVDHDGYLDVYFLNQIGGNALYKNMGNGTFRNITETSHMALADRVSTGGAFADIDNDGNDDLFVTTVRGGNVLLHNDGHGVFTDITKGSGLEYTGHSSAAVFFDFDNDGLLDLLVVNVGRFTTDQKSEQGYYVGQEMAFKLYPDTRFEEKSLLYKNLGGGKFRDVTTATGFITSGWHADATITDYNDDGYPDIYLCNMNGNDQFFENIGGRFFKDVTSRVFPKTSWGSMGVKFFDYNNDLLLDLMTTDMHSDMLAPSSQKEKERKLPAARVPRGVGDLRRNILGNAFYKNLGHGRYEEISDRIGVETYWPWGLSVDDVNADGYQDMFVSSGMGYPYPYGHNYLLMNQGGNLFADLAVVLGIEPRTNGTLIPDYLALDCQKTDSHRQECRRNQTMVAGSRSSRSSAIFDLDNDGDLDIVTNEFNDVPQILVSDLAQQNTIHYLKIQLVGTVSNRNAIGARVEITSEGENQVRYLDGKSGYLSQSQLPLYFGLGDHHTVDRIQVLWPSGRRQTIEGNISPNTLVTIVEH